MLAVAAFYCKTRTATRPQDAEDPTKQGHIPHSVYFFLSHNSGLDLPIVRMSFADYIKFLRICAIHKTLCKDTIMRLTIKQHLFVLVWFAHI